MDLTSQNITAIESKSTLYTEKATFAGCLFSFMLEILRGAGAAGFEPADVGSKGRCLTTWRRPN